LPTGGLPKRLVTQDQSPHPPPGGVTFHTRARKNGASGRAALAAATDQPNRVLLKGLAKENFSPWCVVRRGAPMEDPIKYRAGDKAKSATKGG
jgi:hypothetical protein